MEGDITDFMNVEGGEIYVNRGTRSIFNPLPV